MREIQGPQVGEVPEFGGDRNQAVVREIQDPQVGEVPEFGRNGTLQAVGREVQRRQAGEATELGRNDTSQVDIVGEVQRLQAGEAAEFGRDRTRQMVVREVQRLQAGEAAEFAWDRTCQARPGAKLANLPVDEGLPTQIEPRDAPRLVRLHSAPVPQRRTGQPTVAAAPARAAGGLVEGNEDSPVMCLCRDHPELGRSAEPLDTGFGAT